MTEHNTAPQLQAVPSRLAVEKPVLEKRGPADQAETVSSTVSAPGAFFFTDSMQFLALALEA